MLAVKKHSTNWTRTRYKFEQHQQVDKRNEIGNLGKIEKRERNRGRRIMKRMKEAWNDIYQNSAMSVQILRDNAARFRKGQLLLNFTKLRDGNDLEPVDAVNAMDQTTETDPGLDIKLSS